MNSTPDSSALDPYTLEGKVAIVTGGGKGVGRGIAYALARLGASICIAEIDPNDLADLDKQLGSDFALFIDMPVTLIFAGRETTFSDYLVGPFLDFLAKAMQD